MPERHNVSSDLIWEIVRNQNAYLVKRKSGGGVQFSRDPFNVTNKHSRKHAGFVNEKAISVQPNEKGGISFRSKKPGNSHKPASHNNNHAFKSTSSNRKIFKSVADHTAKQSYRGDLNRDAVSRVSAIKDSLRTKKDTPERKPRGTKAQKASE